MTSTKSSAKPKGVQLQEELEEEQSEGGIRYVPTLQEPLKSLTNAQVKIESEDPRILIQYLGNLLGIMDYDVNLAPFWFLDTLALQLLKTKYLLNNYYRGILASWLIGEMFLIQEMKCSREDFFAEMRKIFANVTDRISKGGLVPYWDTIIKAMSQTEEQHMKELQKEISSIKSSEALRRRTSRKSRTTVTKRSEDSERRKILDSDDYRGYHIGVVDPKTVLNVIIESTYSMYGSDLRYTLVYTIFVERIEMIPFHMVVLAALPPEPRDSDSDDFDRRKKAKKKQRKKPRGLDSPTSVSEPPEVPNEEILTAKREYIYPLIESQKVPAMYDIFKLRDFKDDDDIYSMT